MKVDLAGIGKRYNRDWVLKDIDLQIESGEHLAILGGNGSGKSTLLKIVSGFLGASKGSVTYHLQGAEISVEKIYCHTSFVAPYQDIYRQMTLNELCRLHFSLRAWRSGHDLQRLGETLDLPMDDPLTSFSSGMLQRSKLAMAFATASELLLLDEPTMNLDADATRWLTDQLKDLPPSVTVLVASNIPSEETKTCSRILHIEESQITE